MEGKGFEEKKLLVVFSSWKQNSNNKKLYILKLEGDKTKITFYNF